MGFLVAQALCLCGFVEPSRHFHLWAKLTKTAQAECLCY
jgi:hypothetical protein